MTLSPSDTDHHSSQRLRASGWGSDEDTGQMHPASGPSVVRSKIQVFKPAGGPASGKAASGARSVQRRQVAVPSLQALCIECLEDVLSELLEVGESVLPFLPPHCKAALLARAKQQDLVDDRALRLLTDADWSVLDASNCTQLTDDGLLTALQLAPGLRWLDITGCNVGAAVLRALPALCPAITVLRLGGNATADQAASGALRHFAPQIQHPDAAQESWEQAASGDAADAGGSDRLTQLTHVVWPAIPERLQQRLATQCPRLHFNAFKHSPSSSRKVPPEADPAIALDALLLESWGLLPSQQTADEPVASPAAARQSARPLSIAERFKMAYEERDQQEAAKAMKALQQAARNAAQRKRRAFRLAGSATQEVKRLLCEDW